MTRLPLNWIHPPIMHLLINLYLIWHMYHYVNHTCENSIGCICSSQHRIHTICLIISSTSDIHNVLAHSCYNNQDKYTIVLTNLWSKCGWIPIGRSCCSNTWQVWLFNVNYVPLSILMCLDILLGYLSRNSHLAATSRTLSCHPTWKYNWRPFSCIYIY